MSKRATLAVFRAAVSSVKNRAKAELRTFQVRHTGRYGHVIQPERLLVVAALLCGRRFPERLLHVRGQQP